MYAPTRMFTRTVRRSRCCPRRLATYPFRRIRCEPNADSGSSLEPPGNRRRAAPICRFCKGPALDSDAADGRCDPVPPCQVSAWFDHRRCGGLIRSRGRSRHHLRASIRQGAAPVTRAGPAPREPAVTSQGGPVISVRRLASVTAVPRHHERQLRGAAWADLLPAGSQWGRPDTTMRVLVGLCRADQVRRACWASHADLPLPSWPGQVSLSTVWPSSRTSTAAGTWSKWRRARGGGQLVVLVDDDH